MKSFLTSRWALLILCNAIAWFTFSFASNSQAELRRKPAPQVNPAAQRSDIVRELAEIKRLLSQQNVLFKSGKLQVVVTARN